MLQCSDDRGFCSTLIMLLSPFSRRLSTVASQGVEGSLVKAHLRDMKPSLTLGVNELSSALIAQGVSIHKFGLGQSPFPVPRVMVERLKQHADAKDYLPVQGLPALREAIASFHTASRDRDTTADDVIIGPGTKELLFVLQLCLDADLILPSPSWVSYQPQAQILTQPTSWVETDATTKWKLTPSSLDESLAGSTRPTVCILNYPSNPTGQTYSASELKDLAAVFRSHGTIVLSDEIYGHISFDPTTPHASLATYYPEGTIILGGVSKKLGAGGWRMGYFTFPSNLRPVLSAMAAVASETYSAVSAPIQHACIAAYEPSTQPELNDYVRRSSRILSLLSDHVCASLRDAGASVVSPDGGFYVFPDFTDTSAARRLANSEGGGGDPLTNVKFAKEVLKSTGVAYLGGSAFGRPLNELTARLALVDFDGETALEHIDALPTDLIASDERVTSFLRTHCESVMTGTDKLVEFLRE